MKSIYKPSDLFIDSVSLKEELFNLLKKYGYTNYIIVTAKDDPENEKKLIFDTHYAVLDSAMVDIAKELIEKIENHLDDL